jgi:NAD(P)-dependent dehydrogenase (short-subunit alcohol dehydrogenase family)
MQPIDLYVFTGASRGLGHAMVASRLAPAQHWLAMSRTGAPDLAARAAEVGARFDAWAVDLGDPAPVAARLEAWLAGFDAAGVRSATLVANAALLADPGPLESAPAAQLSAVARVGLEAPMLLAAAFLRATAGWRLPRKLVLISSGLGRRAMAGNASYCAVKAGLDHLARTIALDEARHPEGSRALVCSLAPGVIDTGMQQQLRSADPSRFVHAGDFAAMKSRGGLDSPAAAAAKVWARVDRADFGANPVGDVRDA